MEIIKVPSSEGGLGKSDGAEKAPDMIVKALDEFFYSEHRKKQGFEIESVKCYKHELSRTLESIYKESLRLFKQQKERARDNKRQNNGNKLCFIGGDHSISFPIIRAFSECYKKENSCAAIIFDAHPDAENDFAPVTQEDLVQGIINNKLISADKLFIIGIRNWDKNEFEFLDKNNISYYTMEEISRKGITEIIKAIKNKLDKSDTKAYLSIDIDVVDPAFAPGTGYIEPGGLTTRELIEAIHMLKSLDIAGFDITEVLPDRDLNSMTIKAAAKLIIEML